jgi:hypothetical protein
MIPKGPEVFKRVVVYALLAGGTACTHAPVSSPSGVELITPPPISEIESVLFLVGDAGEAKSHTSPVLEQLRRDIEAWSGALGRDSAVALLVLGDIIYPLGLNPPESEAFDSDTATVMAQVRLVSGPMATQWSTRAYFLSGNHDWGLEEDWEGFVRVGALQSFLVQARTATGALVELAPAAGTGGPVVLDWGRHHRLILIDTAWWLLDNQGGHATVLKGIEDAFASAGEREIILAAHHPFKSGGPHGGGFSVWEALGVRYLLFRSGAILQDVTSRPYRDLEAGLRSIFDRYGVPLAFVGGHEHSLQVIHGVEPSDPRYSLISGAASKLSSLGPLDGLLFGQPAPGYMKLIIDRQGEVSVFVEAATEEFLHCPADEPARSTCMAEGLAAFSTVFSRTLP